MAKLKVIFQPATPQQQHCGGGRATEHVNEMPDIVYVYWRGLGYQRQPWSADFCQVSTQMPFLCLVLNVS